MTHPPRRWRIAAFTQTLTFTEGTARVLLRLGLLSGTELCRPETREAWAPLYTTSMFRDEVPHTGDPAIKAHRRRALRWFPLALPLMWTTWFGRSLATGAVGKRLVGEPSAAHPPARQLTAVDDIEHELEKVRGLLAVEKELARL